MLSIKVPPLGESIVEATISRWLKNEGDSVAPGETLVELETDKVTVEVPASKAGVLIRRLKSEGDVVAVGDDLGELDETANGTGTAAGAPAATASEGAAAQSATATATSAAASSPAPTSGSAPGSAAPSASPSPAPGEAPGEVKASPAARRLSTEQGVDLGAVPGTGRGGVVSKPDVVEHIAGAQAPSDSSSAPPGAPEGEAAGPSSPRAVVPQGEKTAPPAPPAPAPASRSASDGVRETREKMSTRRKRIAEHLLESQHNTAHLTTFNEIDMSAVEALRARVKERVEKEHGVKLSFMPFFAKAACLALRQYPTVNAKIDGESILYHHYVNMGIAVASDAGLVVPNVKGADSMGLLDVGRNIAAVAKKARDGKLTMDDLTGGTFTITNGGVFGSLVSTPIINYPQSGILGLHKIQDRPVAVNGQVVIRPMMYVALSYDHRLIEGQQAVLFLVRVKELMEDPATMIID